MRLKEKVNPGRLAAWIACPVIENIVVIC